MKLKYLLYFCLILLLGINLTSSSSCTKSEYPIDVIADGVVIDAQTLNPIPYAKVYLMSTTSIFFVSSFNDWDKMDSLVTDETGAFHFDFQVSEDIVQVGFYIQKEHYFDYKRVMHYGLGELEQGVIKPGLKPKSYLKIRIVDEAPFSGFESMHILTLLSQDAIQITGNPIDTTVVRWLHAGEAEAFGWYYHNADGSWVPDGGQIDGCPSFDTCYYEIIF